MVARLQRNGTLLLAAKRFCEYAKPVACAGFEECASPTAKKARNLPEGLKKNIKEKRKEKRGMAWADTGNSARKSEGVCRAMRQG